MPVLIPLATHAPHRRRSVNPLLSNGCNLLGVSPFLQQVIIGVVIVLALTPGEFQRRRMAY